MEESEVKEPLISQEYIPTVDCRIRDLHVVFIPLVKTRIKPKVWGAKPDSTVGREAPEDLQCGEYCRSEEGMAERPVIDFKLVVHIGRNSRTWSSVRLKGIY
jgi:hypothetical protein